MSTPYELRYRSQTIKQPTNIKTNEFIENHFGRKTVRYYDSTKKISKDQIKYLVSAAQCSPSSSGAQSWSVIALDNFEDKKKFADVAGEALSAADPINLAAFYNCSVYLIWLLDNHKAEIAIREVAAGNCGPDVTRIMPFRLPARAPTLNRADYSKKPHFNADTHIEYLDQSYYTLRAYADATIAAQTFSILAESIGYKTMYMGSLAHCNTNAFLNVLSLPKRTFPIFGMCVGFEHPSGSDQNGHRRDPDTIAHLRKNPDYLIKPVAPIETVFHDGKYNAGILTEKLHEFNKTLWDFNVGAKAHRDSEYMISRITCRVQQAHDHIGLMLALGNKFDPPKEK